MGFQLRSFVPGTLNKPLAASSPMLRPPGQPVGGSLMAGGWQGVAGGTGEESWEPTGGGGSPDVGSGTNLWLQRLFPNFLNLLSTKK